MSWESPFIRQSFCLIVTLDCFNILIIFHAFSPRAGSGCRGRYPSVHRSDALCRGPLAGRGTGRSQREEQWHCADRDPGEI